MRVKRHPLDLLAPFPAGLMAMWPISTRVNKPANDDAQLLERAAPVEPDAPELDV